MSLCITIGIKKELILYIIVCLQVLGSATAHLKKNLYEALCGSRETWMQSASSDHLQ